MTRATDVFIPLEERTAIANAQGADLFLSIHANSSRNPGVRGIETYFLNFAQDPHAEAVAARENAISAATLKDLQNLVKAIALNSKIDESRDFASSVQEAMVQTIRPIAPDVSDRGVRTAPFYVLIGANMPSILAEIAFVSNPAGGAAAAHAGAPGPYRAEPARRRARLSRLAQPDALAPVDRPHLEIYSGLRRESPLTMLPLLAEPAITWVKVDRPVFDLVGVVLSSLGLAGICAGVALGLGTALGIGFIVRGRREPRDFAERMSLHLLEAPPH